MQPIRAIPVAWLGSGSCQTDPRAEYPLLLYAYSFRVFFSPAIFTRKGFIRMLPQQTQNSATFTTYPRFPTSIHWSTLQRSSFCHVTSQLSTWPPTCLCLKDDRAQPGNLQSSNNCGTLHILLLSSQFNWQICFLVIVQLDVQILFNVFIYL